MNVFLTGAGGYIGGTVAKLLMSAGHSVSGLTRNVASAEALLLSGIRPVLGSLDDLDLLEDQARLADAVLSVANADHMLSVQALLKGLHGSDKPLIHTSGSSIIGDDARGAFCADVIYSDDSKLLVDPRKQPRRDIDLLVLDAAQHAVRSCVICPTLIYGYGKGLNRNSIQIPFLVDNARQQGVIEIVGAGLNIWSNVHILDLAQLYLLALEKAPPGAFYFAENGESSFLDLAQMLSRRLSIPRIVQLSPEVAVQRWGEGRALFSFASNSRVRALRARKELAWQPQEMSLADWVDVEMKV